MNHALLRYKNTCKLEPKETSVLSWCIINVRNSWYNETYCRKYTVLRFQSVPMRQWYGMSMKENGLCLCLLWHLMRNLQQFLPDYSDPHFLCFITSQSGFITLCIAFFVISVTKFSFGCFLLLCPVTVAFSLENGYALNMFGSSAFFPPSLSRLLKW